jgi:hypothetical protein
MTVGTDCVARPIASIGQTSKDLAFSDRRTANIQLTILVFTVVLGVLYVASTRSVDLFSLSSSPTRSTGLLDFVSATPFF